MRLPLNKGGRGTIGRPISLFTNYFPVKFKTSNKILHHYDVKIEDAIKIDGEEKPLDVVGMSAPAAAADAGGTGGKGKRRRKGRPKKKAEEEQQDAAEESHAPVAAVKEAQQTSPEPTTSASTQKGKIPRNKRCAIFAQFIKEHPVSKS